MQRLRIWRRWTHALVTGPKVPLYGALVHDSNNINFKVPIITKQTQQAIISGPETRFHADTWEARKQGPHMQKLSQELSNEISNITRDWQPQILRQAVSKEYKALQQGIAHHPAFDALGADAHICGLFLQSYASILHALHEAKARLGSEWKPQSVLDIGYGPATGILAAQSLFKSEMERSLAVILGHSRMSRRAHQLLSSVGLMGPEHKTLIRHNVPPRMSSAKYDLIIASHQLYHSGDNSVEIADSHAQRLRSLLNPGGVLVFVERGDPFGFEAISRAKEVLFRSDDTDLDVVAPCSHTKKCPLQMGLTTRQKLKNSAGANWCRFSQSIERPRFTLELKKGKYLAQPWTNNQTHGKGGKALAGNGRPHGSSDEEASLSYLVVQCKQDPSKVLPHQALPRILKTPLKRAGHVLMEVCPPGGEIEHWTVTRSYGKQAYHDARKADQGDLWALGAKTTQVRGGLRKHSEELALPVSSSTPVLAIDHWQSPMKEPEEDQSVLESMLMVECGEIDEERARKVRRRNKQSTYSRWN